LKPHALLVCHQLLFLAFEDVALLGVVFPCLIRLGVEVLLALLLELLELLEAVRPQGLFPPNNPGMGGTLALSKAGLFALQEAQASSKLGFPCLKGLEIFGQLDLTGLDGFLSMNQVLLWGSGIPRLSTYLPLAEGEYLPSPGKGGATNADGIFFGGHGLLTGPDIVPMVAYLLKPLAHFLERLRGIPGSASTDLLYFVTRVPTTLAGSVLSLATVLDPLPEATASLGEAFMFLPQRQLHPHHLSVKHLQLHLRGVNGGVHNTRAVGKASGRLRNPLDPAHSKGSHQGPSGRAGPGQTPKGYLRTLQGAQGLA
jgi:hypothetical protein